MELAEKEHWKVLPPFVRDLKARDEKSFPCKPRSLEMVSSRVIGLCKNV